MRQDYEARMLARFHHLSQKRARRFGNADFQENFEEIYLVYLANHGTFLIGYQNQLKVWIKKIS